MTDPSPMEGDLPQISLQALRQNDQAAWHAAYPRLLGAAWRAVQQKWPTATLSEREELACAILTKHVITPLIEQEEGLAAQQTASFRRMQSFSDLLSMTIHICKLRTIDHIRRSVTEARAKEHLAKEQATVETSAVPHFGWSWEGLDQLIDQLKPPKPELVRDRFVLGLTVPEIAEKRTMPIGTVHSHLSRSMTILSNLVASQKPA